MPTTGMLDLSGIVRIDKGSTGGGASEFMLEILQLSMFLHAFDQSV